MKKRKQTHERRNGQTKRKIQRNANNNKAQETNKTTIYTIILIFVTT